MGEGAADLAGLTVAVLQTRHSEVMAGLVRRHGGRPLLAPVLREEDLESGDEVRGVIEQAIAGPLDVAVFQTGVGTRRLFRHAEEAGLAANLKAALDSAVVVERGPKPLAVLLENGVRVDRRTAEPHTTAELVSLLEDLSGRTVLVQQFGAPNTDLVERLRERGASVLEANTYRWALPEDLQPALSFLRELSEGRVDATLFTSLSQVENLFRVAEEAGVTDLAAELGRTVVASVGPTTSRALRDHGVEPAVQPEHPKMVPLIDSLRAHMRAGGGARAPGA